MKKLLCILCSLLIVLFAATGFASGREKRVVLGIALMSRLLSSCLQGKGWDCLLISPAWTASFAAAQSCCRRAII